MPPVIAFYTKIFSRLPSFPERMRLSIEYHFIQIQSIPRRKQQIKILERFR
jgi:hypothetical protein